MLKSADERTHPWKTPTESGRCGSCLRRSKLLQESFEVVKYQITLVRRKVISTQAMLHKHVSNTPESVSKVNPGETDRAAMPPGISQSFL